jgi:phosphatidylglycerophosphate synthase
MKWLEYTKEFDSLATPPSTIFHKHISLPISKFIVFSAYKIRLTPNQLTLLSSIFIFVGMVLIFLPYNKVYLGLINMVLLQLGFILDCSDGILARLINQPSKFGAFFDIFLDRLNNFIVFILFGTAWSLQSDLSISTISVLVYVFSASAYILYTIVLLIQRFIFIEAKGTMQKYGQTLFERFVKTPYQLMNMGTHFFILSLAFIFGEIYYAVVLYGILSFMLTVVIIMYLYIHEKKST